MASELKKYINNSLLAWLSHYMQIFAHFRFSFHIFFHYTSLADFVSAFLLQTYRVYVSFLFASLKTPGYTGTCCPTWLA